MQFVHWKLPIVFRKIVLFKLWHWNDIGPGLQTAQGHSRKDIAHMNRASFFLAWLRHKHHPEIENELIVSRMNSTYFVFHLLKQYVSLINSSLVFMLTNNRLSFGQWAPSVDPVSLDVGVCYDDRPNVLFLNYVFCSNICTFPICAHWHLDFPESVEAGCQSPFFSVPSEHEFINWKTRQKWP